MSDDLIRRSDALKALGEEPEVWMDSDYEIASRNQWNTDRLAIETVPSAQQWIPVTERLPKEEGNYLVCDFHGNNFINYFWVVSAEWSVRCHIISAWMPLPQPWEGGAENE